MVRFATKEHLRTLSALDPHISKEELENSVRLQRVFVSEDHGKLVGWLRYNLFWDNTPFLNLLFVLKEERGKGYGKELILFWEREMRKKGYGRLLTSTQSDEQAQFFYRKFGYIDCGSLLLPGEPLEILFLKEIGEDYVPKHS